MQSFPCVIENVECVICMALSIVVIIPTHIYIHYTETDQGDFVTSTSLHLFNITSVLYQREFQW